MDNERDPLPVPEEAAPAPAKAEEPKQTMAQNLYDWVEVLVIAVTIVMVTFAFVVRMATVNGPSMTPTLLNGEQVVVWELGYHPKQGDVIVCQSKPHGFDEPLVKRVIATEGQIVEIDTGNWTVYVDGKAIDEPYVNFVEGAAMHGWDYGTAYIVPEGCVFVMGDNRNNSSDSRRVSVGPIDERLIVGKVVFRLLPFDRAGSIA